MQRPPSDNILDAIDSFADEEGWSSRDRVMNSLRQHTVTQLARSYDYLVHGGKIEHTVIHAAIYIRRVPYA